MNAELVSRRRWPVPMPRQSLGSGQCSPGPWHWENYWHCPVLAAVVLDTWAGDHTITDPGGEGSVPWNLKAGLPEEQELWVKGEGFQTPNLGQKLLRGRREPYLV